MKTIQKQLKMITMLVLMLALLPQAFAALQLTDIQFDPVIIAAGDEVDIIIQYEEAGIFDDDKIANPEYSFKVQILPDDDLTENHVTFLDSKGDHLYGTIYSNQEVARIFRVKINQDAPAANYEFKLEGQWHKNDKPEGSPMSVTFTMPVKKEGIVLDVSTIQTEPAQVRPGDKFVQIKTTIVNTGEKPAQAINLELIGVPGIEPSYSDNNKKYIAALRPNEQQEIIFSVNINDTIASGEKKLQIKTAYEDVDNNNYQAILPATLLLKPRPFLEVTSSSGSTTIGGSGKLIVQITNTGEQSAEAVDARIIKQYSQPFTIDVRSDYIGEIQPGETAQAVFDIQATRDANEKIHTFQLVLRAKGDSDEGDDTIYTFNRRAEFEVAGKAPNYVLYAALLGAAAIIVFLIVKQRGKKK